jgi:3-hydroxyacyl-CoA dehydrogenase
VVGLDTMAHVIKTLQDNLKDRSLLRQLRHAARAGQADRAGQPGPEDQGRLLQEGRPRHLRSSSTARTTCPQAPRPTRSMAACSRSPRPSA